MTDSDSADSFESMTKKHVDAMWRTAWRMTGCRDTADDLVQEACLRAFRAFDDYQTGTNYKAWLFRILTNLCKDSNRRQARAPFKTWDDVEVDAVTATAKGNDGISQPEREIRNDEFIRDAYSAMHRLPPNIRIVVSLSLLSELNYAEIAQMVDIPVGTVRSRLSRGRMQLQRDLIEHDQRGSKRKSRLQTETAARETPNVTPLYPEIAKQK